MSWQHRGFTWKPQSSLTLRENANEYWLVEFAYLSHSPCIRVYKGDRCIHSLGFMLRSRERVPGNQRWFKIVAWGHKVSILSIRERGLHTWPRRSPSVVHYDLCRDLDAGAIWCRAPERGGHGKIQLAVGGLVGSKQVHLSFHESTPDQPDRLGMSRHSLGNVSCRESTSAARLSFPGMWTARSDLSCVWLQRRRWRASCDMLCDRIPPNRLM